MKVSFCKKLLIFVICIIATTQALPDENSFVSRIKKSFKNNKKIVISGGIVATGFVGLSAYSLGYFDRFLVKAGQINSMPGGLTSSYEAAAVSSESVKDQGLAITSGQKWFCGLATFGVMTALGAKKGFNPLKNFSKTVSSLYPKIDSVSFYIKDGSQMFSSALSCVRLHGSNIKKRFNRKKIEDDKPKDDRDPKSGHSEDFNNDEKAKNVSQASAQTNEQININRPKREDISYDKLPDHLKDIEKEQYLLKKQVVAREERPLLDDTRFQTFYDERNKIYFPTSHIVEVPTKEGVVIMLQGLHWPDGHVLRVKNKDMVDACIHFFNGLEHGLMDLRMFESLCEKGFKGLGSDLGSNVKKCNIPVVYDYLNSRYSSIEQWLDKDFSKGMFNSKAVCIVKDHTKKDIIFMKDPIYDDWTKITLFIKNEESGEISQIPLRRVPASKFVVVTSSPVEETITLHEALMFLLGYRGGVDDNLGRAIIKNPIIHLKNQTIPTSKFGFSVDRHTIKNLD